jgi:large subunit ribosomal protein L19
MSVNIQERKKANIRAGNTVRVWQKIVDEKGKTRLQAFEGMVIAHKHGYEPGATFTVRKVSGGIGVEKIFPLYSPNIDKIETTRKAEVRRSKLYYVREKTTKQIRKKIKELKKESYKSDTTKKKKPARHASEDAGEVKEDEEPKITDAEIVETKE